MARVVYLGTNILVSRFLSSKLDKTNRTSTVAVINTYSGADFTLQVTLYDVVDW